MSGWDGHLITPESLGVTWKRGTGAVLGALVAHARLRWPLLHNGIRALEQAGRRGVAVGDVEPLPVELLHNPARMGSVVAVPSVDSWCPLCVANLPDEEQGIPVGMGFVALPNPAPIIRDHIVLAHRNHVPQALEPCVEDLAWVLAAVDEDTVLLYNGPTSGASSPFHRHLQAGRAQDLPLTSQRHRNTHPPRTTAWGSVEAVEAGARRFIMLTIRRPSASPEALTWALNLLHEEREFPVNLVVWKRDASVIGALFPRGRHRPACFFRSDAQRIVVSPGSVEMAGLVVLPRREDWDRVDSRTLAGIYGEVGVDDDVWRSLLQRLAG